MATAAICGSGGSITGTGATEITSWEITLNQEAVDATSMASAGWKERVACLIGATGNFKSIGSSSTVGAHAGCVFLAAGGGFSVSGAIIISKITVSTPVDGVCTFSHDFSFTGTVTCSLI